MSWTQTSLPTLDHYAFDLRSGLRDAAKKSLQALEENINDLGYAWLDGYMEGIMARAQSNAPITTLIKTPSRTHGTSKKTRATTAAGKERADKVKALNAKSPLSKTANTSLSARQPLSPLQPRLLNLAPPSPSPLGPSSSPGPTKGKADKSQTVPSKEKSGKGKAKAKAKGKKAKGKKVADEDVAMEPENTGTPAEVDEPMEEERPSKPSSKTSKASKSSGKSASAKSREILEQAKAPAPLATEQPVEADEKDEPMEAEAPEPVLDSGAEATNEKEAQEAAHDEDIARPTSLAPTTQTQQTDLSMIDEGDEDTSSASSGSARPADKKSGSGSVSASQRSTQVIPVVESTAHDASSQADSASDVVKATGQTRKSLEDMIVAQAIQPESGASASASAGNSSSQAIESPAPSQPANPPVPVRQVRSSWLTKALGTDKVPITAATATATTSTADRDTFRKSFAANSQRPPQVDFSSFRKSLVPAGTLKRKSEVGMDEDRDGDDDEEIRPEKVIKVDVPATTPGAVPTPAAAGPSTSASVPARPTFDRQVSRERERERERESIFPVRPTSAPHAVVVPATTPGPAHAGAADAQEHASADRHRSDIHKVTKALDELRERAREKEAAAKAKAMTLAASAGPKRTSTVAQANTGTGFLRGLGSLGVGLGRSLGLGGQGQKSAEDDALRLQREVEEERRASLEAKEELARLMGEMEKDKDKPVPTAPIAVSSGKHDMEDNMQAEQDELDPDTDDEREVTEQIEMDVEPTEFVTAPQANLAAPTVSPPRRPRPAMQSTTPSGTPPRKVPAREAPALHARQEKHAHPSPAREAHHPPTRAAEPAPAEVLVRHPSDEHVARPSKAASAAALRPAPSPGAQARAREASTQDDLADEEMEEIDDQQEIMRRPLQPQTSKGRIQNSSSSTSLAPSQLLGASSSSQATTIGSLSQASTVAGKMLGVKPSVAPVKSVQLAAAAAKKDLAASEKRAVSRDQIEQRKRDLAERRAEQDRAREEEIKRARMVELDEKRRQRAEQEKKRKEAEERKLALAQAKKAKEEEEREREREAAAKAKAEEDAKKRKLAQSQAMNKSTGPANGNGMKRVGPTAPAGGATISSTQGLKGKEPVRIAKPAAAGVPSKLGPTSFRTAPSASAHEQPHQTHASTITLVTPQQPRSLGPPSRPSQMTGQAGHHPHPQPVRASVAVQQQQQQQQYHATTLQTQQGSAVLQHSREALQQTLEERALEVQSEDIVLPDIASEYSDSDDEERSPDFKRPQWAESPELRAALAEQAYRDPDELFGPIKPISMEELFKVRQGKFRARTSSANWAKGDGLTRAEEVEYARRMGFRPIGQSSQGSGA